MENVTEEKEKKEKKDKLFIRIRTELRAIHSLSYVLERWLEEAGVCDSTPDGASEPSYYLTETITAKAKTAIDCCNEIEFLI